MGLTIREYAIADPTLAAAMGLSAAESGMLFCVDEEDNRVTVIGDADLVRMIKNSPPEVAAGVEITAEAFPLRRDGWPDEW